MTYISVIVNVSELKSKVLDEIETGGIYEGYSIVALSWNQGQVLVLLKEN